MKQLHSLTHSLLLASLAMGVATPSAIAQAYVGSGQALSGQTAGTERWIVCKRGRGYDLGLAMQGIRTAAPGTRVAQLAGLQQAAQADQAAIAQRVIAAGGTVRRHYWCTSALLVEIPPAAVQTLRRVPGIHSLWPVQGRPLDDAMERSSVPPAGVDCVLATPPIPMANSMDERNHNIEEAWRILGESQGPLGARYRGAGAVLAVFDSGIDRDVDHSNSAVDHHPNFVVDPTVAQQSLQTRILAHLQAPPVTSLSKYADCNVLTGASPYANPIATSFSGYSPYIGSYPDKGHHSHCGHGTAMAAVAAGNAYSLQYGLSFVGSGHAPDANLVDVACTSYTGSNATKQWEFTSDRLLSAIEELHKFILNDNEVHVANLSIGSDPSPHHPVALAFDELASLHDVMLVTSAGNAGDTTISSPGFYHGLAVGAVHARTAATGATNLSFVPLPHSSRGPLVGSNSARYYPDVCATGAGVGHLDNQGVPGFDYEGFYTGGNPVYMSYFYPGTSSAGSQGVPLDGCLVMPGIDVGDPTSTLPLRYTAPVIPNPVTPFRPRVGTSAACAQVAGAATLYRGFRPSATAEETRAAILLNVVGTYTSVGGTTAEPELQHTYTGRNTFGVGYVRDDVLAQFAVRDVAFDPQAMVLDLSENNPSVDVTFSNRPAGARYAVVACWQRFLGWYEDPSGEGNPLPNVDLLVINNGGGVSGTVIAKSTSPANSYERVVFVVPGSGDIRLRVSTDTEFPAQDISLPVQIVMRRLPDGGEATPVVDRVRASSGIAEVLSAGASCVEQDHDWMVTKIFPYPHAYGSAAFQRSEEMVLSGSNWIPQGYYRHGGYHKGFDLGMARSASHTALGSYQYLLHLQYKKEVVGGSFVARGLAFRTWRPLTTPSDLEIEKITMEEGGWNVPTGLFSFPGPGATIVVQTPTPPTPLRTIRAPSSMAATAPAGVSAANVDGSDFRILVPFDAPFSYSGTGVLHVWIKCTSTASEFLVDGTRDVLSGTEPIECHIADGSTNPHSTKVFNGVAPVLGFVTESSVVPRELRLVVHGEPWSGAVQDSLLDVDVFSGPGLAGDQVFLFLGVVSGTAIPISGTACSGWVLSPIATLIGTADAFGMESFAVPIPESLVNFELGLQAFLLNGTQVLAATNALRLRLGGGL